MPRPKSTPAIAQELLDNIDQYSPGSTFTGPPEQRKQFEREAKASFELFADSWLRPKLRQIAAKKK